MQSGYKAGFALVVLAGCALACDNKGSSGRDNGTAGATTTGGSSAAGASSGGAASGGTPTTGGSTATAGSTQTDGGKAGESTGGAGSGSGGAGTAGATSGGWTYPEGVTKPKIMIIGDSISAGPGCWKKYALKDLKDNGYTNYEFVGEYTDDCGGNVKHSAVSCSTAEQYTQDKFTVPNCNTNEYQGLAPLAAKHKPDLLLMQLGVNDVWSYKTPEVILASYAKLVEQARAQNPKIAIVVAQIQKIRPDCDKEELTTGAENLIKAVPAWAAKQNTAASPVFVADLWTNSDWSKTETLDCVHPNEVGAERMGMNWYNALKGILKHD